MGPDRASGGAPAMMRVDKVIPTFCPSKRYRADEADTSVLSLDFDDSGEFAVAARNDDTIQLYNCKDGKHVKELKSQKYGAHLARFTHHSHSILYASTRVDDMVRYLSAHDNSYICYFRGHEAPVTAIEVCPSNDTFMTCSLDNTLRFWSLNTPTATGILNLKGVQTCAFDPSASVIAVASPASQTVLLYDYRNYDKPPFATFDLQAAEQRFAAQSRRAGSGPSTPLHNDPLDNWTRMSFSNDGRSLLVSTAGRGHFVLDAFNGDLRAYLPKKGPESNRLLPSQTPSTASRASNGPNVNGRNAYKLPALGQGDACWSPDGRYVIGGLGMDPSPPTRDNSTSANNTTGEMTTTPFGSNGGLLVWDLYVAKPGSDAGIKSAMGDDDYQPTARGTTTGPGSGGLGEYSGFEVTTAGRAIAPVMELNGPGRAEVVGYNPRFNMIVSADKDLVMWTPNQDLF